MIEEDGSRTISDDFADLLIEYSGDVSVFDSFPEATVNIINYLYAVVHIPARFLTLELIRQFGYSIVPNPYGIISQSSVEATGIQRLRNIPNFDLRGQGVLVGFIDTGIEYTNPIFRYPDGTTRIASIWDQTVISERRPENFVYGTEYTREEINLALAAENPLDIVQTTDEIGHGTMLAGVAAGNEVPEANFYGIASESEFVVVKLKPAKQPLRQFYLIPEDAVAYSEVDVLFGVYYLLQVANALNRPMVICIGIGSSQGGHDGRGILSNTLSLIGTRPGIVVVVAAGNEGNGRRHYFGRVNPISGFDTVELTVGPNEGGFVLELWGESPSIYSIDITSPSGEYIPRITASIGQTTEISFLFEKTIIYLVYELIEAQTGDQVIALRFNSPAEGIWRFNVYERGDLNLGFHMWLPMEKFISENTYFIRSDIYTTILSVGTAVVPLTVTAYNDMDNSLYFYAGRGFTRTGVIKPEFAAPGVNVVGPAPGNRFLEYSGTSVAAAHATGVVAMLLEWGYVRRTIPSISSTEIKKLILRGARRDPDIVYPNRDWGYGILDIYNVFSALRTVVTP